MRRSPGLHAAPLYEVSNAVPCAVTGWSWNSSGNPHRAELLGRYLIATNLIDWIQTCCLV
jgi:hypothetical protein